MHLHTCGSRRLQGLALAEVLIALLLLAGGVAWVLQANVMALRAASQAYTELLATKGVLDYQLERLRSTSFDDPALAVPTDTAFSDTPALQDGSLPGAQGHYWVEFENGDPNLKRITVQVTWTDPDGRARTSTASTLVGQGGLFDD